MRVRLIRKLAEQIDGVDLTGRAVGDVLDIPDREALMLVSEGWATAEEPLRAESIGASGEYLLADAQRLVASSRQHEQRLSSLVTQLEGEGSAALCSTPSLVGATAAPHLDVAAMGPEMTLSTELLGLVRDLCVAAREQRQLAETLLMRMLGDRAVTDAPRVRVLVADDSDDSRELAATVVEAAGYHAITARNGLEALIAAHRADPAVVLMDVTMPVLDGIEAARLLKASAATRHLKIVAYTAKPEFCEGPLARLFVDVLRKPTTPGEIAAAVRRFVEAESS